MIILFDYEVYRSMLNLGIETWVPRATWKWFQVSFNIGPLRATITIGSRAKYDKLQELLK